jgi:hypothetical protein
MLGDSIRFSYTASIGRSDDYNRGFYKIQLKVLKDVDFDRLDIFQLAAPTYHYSTSDTLAYGNENGLISRWASIKESDTDKKRPKAEACIGKIPWFSFGSTKLSPNQDTDFIGGNKGFIIRKWNAKINSVNCASPSWQEYYTKEGNHGPAGSIINITLPEGCHSLKEGDYIEAEIEMVILPLTVQQYYGTDTEFIQYFTNHSHNWQLVYREAKGNRITVELKGNEVLHSYPIVIRTKHNKALFSIKGGIGYIPLRIEGLTSYKNPKLFEKTNGKWVEIDQSHYGKDFWQTDFDSETGTYQITYNVKAYGSEKKKRMKFIIDK